MASIASGLPGKGVCIAKLADRLAALTVAVILAGIVSGTASARTTHEAKSPSHKASPYHAVSASSRARNYYLSVWGVDNLLARQTASGNLIRFSYRVVDPTRASLLGDKRATPYMYGERTRALLHIPVMEQVGPLRQSTPPKAGKEYWMVFSNKGNFVRAGDRVDVIIGTVHVDGLLVE